MQNILITGASKGIGKAIAIKLASNDSHIFIHGRDQKALDDVSNAIEKKGGDSTQIIADISAPAGCQEIIGAVGKNSIDVLVNNAAVAYVKPFDQLTLDEWNKTIAINITAPFLITKGLLPNMKKGSSIVNILSISAKVVHANWSSYCMSKHALRGFAESIREELRPRGIRVINVFPYSVDTPIWETIPGNWPREKMMIPDDVANAVAFAVSMRDGVMVDDITLEGMAGRL